jgi:hypothetical protein
MSIIKNANLIRDNKNPETAAITSLDNTCRYQLTWGNYQIPGFGYSLFLFDNPGCISFGY